MMAQNTTPAQAANPLKRKNPPPPQERSSTAVKRATTTTTEIYAHAPPSELHSETMAFLQEPGFDGDSVEQNSQDEEDKEVSEDGQVEENEEGCEETETDSDKSLSGDKEGHQPQAVAEPMGPYQRQAKFPGFNKAMELVLLKALNAVKPFGAKYGEKAEAWARVARHLKEDDDKERGKGKEARFGLVNARNCKEKWIALSAEYASIAAGRLRDSGTNPTVDARYIELEEAYLYEQSCLNTKTAKKRKRYHVQTQAVLKKTNGDRLLVASRTGPVQGWTVEGQEIALDFPTEEDPPLRFSTGSLSGTESDTNQSTNTRLQQRPPRTPGMKKRALAVIVTEQLTLAAEAMRYQLEYNKQHLAFLREEREEWRKAEEARIRREELRIRREETSWRDRQDIFAKLIEAQTVISERIAKQHTENMERILQAIIQLAQRK